MVVTIKAKVSTDFTHFITVSTPIIYAIKQVEAQISWQTNGVVGVTNLGFVGGLAHVATDRSMTAALASQDPLTVGASARIVTHTLMSSGHLAAAVTTAQNHAARLDRETGITTPESLSVYGSVLLRGALAASRHDETKRLSGMAAEAARLANRFPRTLG